MKTLYSLKEDERIYWLANAYYNKSSVILEETVNDKVIRVLCDMIVSIWTEWRADTRHYQPSKRKTQWYLDKIDYGEGLLQADQPGYELAKRVVKDSREFIKLVVSYRIHPQKRRAY